jgi:valyl-tRNA synthetase
MIDDKFLKPYNAGETEAKIYKIWEDSGFFNPDKLPVRHQKPYSIILPPPNATGILHMGHALMITLQDIMIRYHRMAGYKTLWIPGTDHAAIATQSKVEKDIAKKEGKSRYDLGREELLKRIDTFVEGSRHTIATQARVLGASCDWSREAFTLDEKRNLGVRTLFKQMYDDGLIVRKHRIVNWDPKGQTTISDDEVVYEERDAKFYTFKYSKDFPISISTTRPETKLGDTAVAVHPEDTRYQKYIGQTFEIADFCGVPLKIKIIADKEVDKEFGTGALGVTPAHSMIDWLMGVKNNLPVIQVIDEKARMMIGSENIKGKKVTEAREIVVAWLKEQGLLEKEENVKQNVSTAERTGGIIEPLPKLQWWVAVNNPFLLKHSKIDGLRAKSEVTLKDVMRHTVESGQIKIIPDYSSKVYFHWINKLDDWCISRQIWYGHRIPVWYKGEEVYCGIEAPTGDGWIQDEDTLDTWFSSALWTFSTMGWPKCFNNETGEIDPLSDLAKYHPTDVLETGGEILFFWVARMIMMTGYAIGQIPFKTVYLNGTVRDSQGRKFSKSLNNGVDPIDVAKKFGTDAGRMSLIIGNTPGMDFKYSEDKLRAQMKFANKVWNATRFVLTSIEGFNTDTKPTLSPEDTKTLNETNEIIKDITKDIEEFRFYMASDKIYNYFWHTFADTVIERTKLAINGSDEKARQSAQYILFKILTDMIKVLHPFMPFVTEEIWSLLPIKSKKLLMIEEWPVI